MHKHLKPFTFATLALAFALGSAQPAQAGGMFSISPDKERKIGAEAAKEVEQSARIVQGPVADWVNIVGQRLAAVSDPQFHYTFHVIDSPEINAFTLPGGYIYVYTGMRKVAHTDDELAAVLAHEITHAEMHHYAEAYKKESKQGALLGIIGIVAGLPGAAQEAISVLNYSMTQKYSRSLESQADNLGMKRMIRAGFNPQSMVDLLGNLTKEDDDGSELDTWFSDHPAGKKRVADAQNELTSEVPKLVAQNSPLVRPIFPAWSPDDLQGNTVIPINAPPVQTPAAPSS